MRQTSEQGRQTRLCLLLALLCLSAGSFAQDDPAAFDLDTANNNFSEFYEDGLYNQATVAATRALWMARVNYGEESIEAALAQINLANAQQKSADHPAAIDSFEQSIRRIEAVDGVVSARLVKPLMGLAASQNVIGAFDRGLVNYQRALRLNHVDNGLYNEKQLPIRDSLTETYLALGEQADAEFQQEIQVIILQQEYGNDPAKVIPAMYKLANWYGRTNQPTKQAYQYQAAVRLIREQSDKNSPDQIEALRELSNIYRRMDMPAESMRLLKRAYRLNAEAEQPDPVLAADIQIQIGDFYNMFGDRRSAREHYKIAWNTLTGMGGQETLLNEYFAQPVNLEGPPLPQVYPANSSTAELFFQEPGRFTEGYVLAEYDVDADGRVRNVRIIESEPVSLIDKKIRVALSRHRYRPRIVAGAFSAASGERIRHSFNYEPPSEQEEQDNDTEKLGRPGQQLFTP